MKDRESSLPGRAGSEAKPWAIMAGFLLLTSAANYLLLRSSVIEDPGMVMKIIMASAPPLSAFYGITALKIARGELNPAIPEIVSTKPLSWWKECQHELRSLWHP